MARPGLTRHRKFAQLAGLLGSDALALGHLEFMWQAAYESGDDLLGDAASLEYLAHWRGDAGRLAEAMRASGFVDDSPEGLRVHDLWHHAPTYVTKRAAREAERTEKGETLSTLRSKAGRKGADRRWQVDGKRNPLAISDDGKRMANGIPPAPSPSPTQELLSAAASAAVELFPQAPAEEGAPVPAVAAAETAPPKAKRPPAAKSERREASPEAREKRASWERLFEQERHECYRWTGPADQLAANALAPVNTLVFEAKALRGLRGVGFQRCSTLAQLKAKWNDLAGPATNGVAHVIAAHAPVAAIPEEESGYVKIR